MGSRRLGHRNQGTEIWTEICGPKSGHPLSLALQRKTVIAAVEPRPRSKCVCYCQDRRGDESTFHAPCALCLRKRLPATWQSRGGANLRDCKTSNFAPNRLSTAVTTGVTSPPATAPGSITAGSITGHTFYLPRARWFGRKLGFARRTPTIAKIVEGQIVVWNVVVLTTHTLAASCSFLCTVQRERIARRIMNNGRGLLVSLSRQPPRRTDSAQPALTHLRCLRD